MDITETLADGATRLAAHRAAGSSSEDRAARVRLDFWLHRHAGALIALAQAVDAQAASLRYAGFESIMDAHKALGGAS